MTQIILTLRILVHPNLVPDENNDSPCRGIQLLNDVVKAGRFDVALHIAIEQYKLVSSIDEFPAIVLGLWLI